MDYFFPVNANKNVGLDLKDKKILTLVGFTLIHLVSRQTYENPNCRHMQTNADLLHHIRMYLWLIDCHLLLQLYFSFVIDWIMYQTQSYIPLSLNNIAGISRKCSLRSHFLSLYESIYFPERSKTRLYR